VSDEELALALALLVRDWSATATGMGIRPGRQVALLAMAGVTIGPGRRPPVWPWPSCPYCRAAGRGRHGFLCPNSTHLPPSTTVGGPILIPLGESWS